MDRGPVEASLECREIDGRKGTQKEGLNIDLGEYNTTGTPPSVALYLVT